ncbi:KTSC domain-containing protein [Pedobacter steynii]
MPSSVIDRILYNKEEQVLTVIFLSGQVYDYKNVPYNTYLSFRAARSKGRYLNKYIKGVYQYENLAD